MAEIIGRAKVLLVEDEGILLALVSRVLQGMGLTVLEAVDGPAALRLAEAYPGAIDLLVADVVMPGFGGAELAERLVGLRPNLRVLYLSGHPEYALGQCFLPLGNDLLVKPFRIDELERRVLRILTAGPAAGPNAVPCPVQPGIHPG
jgi:two-component system cell cycle sensor histidine kinase/response regulator CckA